MNRECGGLAQSEFSSDRNESAIGRPLNHLRGFVKRNPDREDLAVAIDSKSAKLKRPEGRIHLRGASKVISKQKRRAARAGRLTATLSEKRELQHLRTGECTSRFREPSRTSNRSQLATASASFPGSRSNLAQAGGGNSRAPQASNLPMDTSEGPKFIGTRPTGSENGR